MSQISTSKNKDQIEIESTIIESMAFARFGVPHSVKSDLRKRIESWFYSKKDQDEAYDKTVRLDKSCRDLEVFKYRAEKAYMVYRKAIRDSQGPQRQKP